MKIIDWLNEWFSIYKKPKLKPHSSAVIETVIRLHIPEYLKDKELDEVKAYDFDKAVSLLTPSRTQKVLYDVFVASLLKAYKFDLIEKDISKLLEPVRYKLRRSNPLTEEELSDFFDNIEGHKLEHLFKFYVLSGCRRHEALTLLWSDIDFDKRSILIRGTKTSGSHRLLPLTNELNNLLCSIPQTDNRVFPFNDDYATKQFKKLCPSHHLHELRHTFATVCAVQGVYPSATQKMLGHSKIDTTMRIYTHVATAFVQKESQKLDFNAFMDNKKD